MPEYIKRADVIKLCEGYSEHCHDNCDFQGEADFERIQEDIEQLPTADVAEVKHGHWIEDGEYQICSECGEEHHWDEYRATYCEDCGAKMDGRSDT